MTLLTRSRHRVDCSGGGADSLRYGWTCATVDNKVDGCMDVHVEDPL